MMKYAVRSADVRADVALPVSQRIPAGTVGVALEAGTVARIFTGAPIPKGADAVVMQELTEIVSDGVMISGDIDKGENIRDAGEDIKQGEQGLILSFGPGFSAQRVLLEW